MTSFSEIKGLEAEAVELFEATGYMDASDINGLSILEITKELNKTNLLLDIVEGELTTEMVKVFLKPIEAQLGEVEDDTPDINRENIIAHTDLLSTPFAIPISGKFLEENPVPIGKLPVAGIKFVSESEAIKHIAVTPTDSFKQLTGALAEATKSVVQKEEERKAAPSDPPPTQLKRAPHGMGEKAAPSAADLDRPTERGRMLSMDDFRLEGSEIAPLQRDESNDLTRMTKEATNKGINPSSRRYIKGVLHSHSGSFKLSTYAFLFSQLCFVLTLVGIALVLYNKVEYWWAMFSPVLFFIGLFIFFVFTRAAQCPICRQKEFALRTCLKHRNAHRWPLVGYMLPTALHITLFKWFRCIYCGTAVRLKE